MAHDKPPPSIWWTIGMTVLVWLFMAVLGCISVVDWVVRRFRKRGVTPYTQGG